MYMNIQTVAYLKLKQGKVELQVYIRYVKHELYNMHVKIELRD